MKYTLLKYTLPIHLTAPRSVDPAHEKYLDNTELVRANAFKFANDRTLYVAAHSFLRQTLSQYAPLAPEAWCFVCNAYGKPAIANRGYEQLTFNLSHTTGLIACAISYKRDVGVDVEQRKTLADMPALCRYAFTSKEAERVLAHDDLSIQEARFFTYWTLKEAYIKAKGMGLSIPLQDFYFDQDVDQDKQRSWHLHTIEKSLEDKRQQWQFNTFASEQHHLAVAVALDREVDQKTPISPVAIKLIVADQSFQERVF